MKKIILLTGASSGIGYQTAESLAKEGHVVYGAARRIEKMETLKQFGVNKPIYLDVTDEESIKSAIDTIIRNEGRIDVLINNAGYGSFGAVEDVDISEAKMQFEVNLFGLARLVQLVLPHMRKQKSGRIINVSSMGGRMTSYFGGWYHATKYALEAFSDELRMEVTDFGIDVSLIEPGLIKTDWGIIAANKLADSSKGGAYEKEAMKTAKGMKKLFKTFFDKEVEKFDKTMVSAGRRGLQMEVEAEKLVEVVKGNVVDFDDGRDLSYNGYNIKY